MSQSSTDTVTVQYSTSDDTATSSDYTPAAAQTLTFAAGETEKTVSIATTDDSADEENESFQLVLSNPSQNAELACITTATGTIIDNDEQVLSDDATLSALDLEDAQQRASGPDPTVHIRNDGLHRVRGQQRQTPSQITPTKNHTGASRSRLPGRTAPAHSGHGQPSDLDGGSQPDHSRR